MMKLGSSVMHRGGQMVHALRPEGAGVGVLAVVCSEVEVQGLREMSFLELTKQQARLCVEPSVQLSTGRLSSVVKLCHSSSECRRGSPKDPCRADQMPS